MPRRQWFPPPRLSPAPQDSLDPSSSSSFVVVVVVAVVVVAVVVVAVVVAGSGVADIVAADGVAEAAVGVPCCRGDEADCDSLVVAVVAAVVVAF